MGEAWSDWYAFDYLDRAGLSPETAAPGERTSATSPTRSRTPCARSRSTARSSSGDTPSDACPGTDEAGPGGYTYADFGKIIGFAEVHTDGEIWGETLWDLRSELIAAADGDVASGSDTVEALVTGGLRLSPPNPSFLDSATRSCRRTRRSSAARTMTSSGRSSRTAAWATSPSTPDATDSDPVADFSLPPSADTPQGSVTGKVYDVVSGLPLSGVRVGIGGQSTPGYDGALADTTGDDGRYSFTAPAHTYRR